MITLNPIPLLNPVELDFVKWILATITIALIISFVIVLYDWFKEKSTYPEETALESGENKGEKTSVHKYKY